ncbi:MAG: DUF2510 domain-containing protein [Ilumatobacteraceae bacterium]
MAQSSGWFPDPYGRFQQRYHDGSAWTAHVANDGKPLTDPMGTTAVVPFALPASAVAKGSPWPPPNSRDRRG